MKKIHYVMPMAGRGFRFSEKGYNFPKPLIEIYGKPFFYWATQSIRKFINIATLDFVVLKEHIENYQIDKEILFFFPESRIHILSEVTEGAVITCKKGIEGISDKLPIIFNDCDHLFKSSDFNSFCNGDIKEEPEGVLLTFLSDNAKYSFVERDKRRKVIRTAEKDVISNEAICGCYYFSNAEVYNMVSDDYIKKCNYSEYYMSGVYNIMIQKGMQVMSMTTDFHVPFGTPAEYEEAKKRLEYEKLV